MSATLEQVLAVVRDFVREKSGQSPPLSGDTKLLQEGLIDSFALIELIGQLEQKLGLQLPMGSLIPEDFESPSVLWERLQQL